METMETFFVLKVSMYLHIIISIDAKDLGMGKIKAALSQVV